MAPAKKSFTEQIRSGFSSLTGEEPEPEVEMNAMEKAWSQASSTVKASVTPLAALAGLNTSVNGPRTDQPQSDEENLMSDALGAVRGASDDASQELKGICPGLTYKERLIGALSCAALGLVIDIFATMALLLGKAHIPDFALLYTLGNLTAICGSAFVVGPCRQAKLMCKPVRRIACTIYLGAMVGTIIVAIVYPNILLIFLMMFVQYCALIWYGASFIPYGRTCIIKGCQSVGNGCKKSLALDEI
mmetsp:Transcript_29293/g.59922  ORF Transcript_29293/g.59922 Transcript_29293/m.59922 type:complete len:246 (+) Transcript_29293:125-862(+)